MQQDRAATIVAQWRAQRPDLDASPLLVLGRIAHLAARVDSLLRPPFADSGLGPGEFDVLAALRRAGKPFRLTPGQLADAMLVTTGAVTKRVDRLVERGLASRSVAEGDGRGRVVTLTSAGRRLTDRLIALHLANERRLLSGLTDEEVASLGHLLGRLSDVLPDRSEDRTA